LQEVKVRLKSNWHPGYVKEVQRTACLDGKDHYLFTDGTWCTSDSYEPIPTSTWRDVTSECEVIGHDIIDNSVKGGAYIRHCFYSDNYRIRKVDLNHGIERVGRDAAFIVEKKDHA
jgi:hypothetical protein